MEGLVLNPVEIPVENQDMKNGYKNRIWKIYGNKPVKVRSISHRVYRKNYQYNKIIILLIIWDILIRT